MNWIQAYERMYEQPMKWYGRSRAVVDFARRRFARRASEAADDARGAAAGSRVSSLPDGAVSTAIALTGVGLAAGAAIVYFADGARGGRRRALLVDKVAGLRGTGRQFARAASVTGRDLLNRSKGLFAELRRKFRSGAAPDHVLVDRVRARLGRHTTTMRWIAVDADDLGNVELSGHCLESEHADIVKTVESIKGVNAVCDALDVHGSRAEFPADAPGAATDDFHLADAEIEGDEDQPRQPPGEPIDLAKDHWSPATRFVVGTAGATLMTYTAVQRTLPAALLGTVGAALMVRAATNLPAKRLVGVGAGRHAVDIKKTVNIDAPVALVFGFWSNYDNFPLFMSNVRKVTSRPDGTSRWEVAGPAGTTVTWDAVLTDFEPHRMIGWRSVEGSTVASSGFVNFAENDAGGTRVDVHMRYNPPAGAIGHALASLLGANPRAKIDDDLNRMKVLIETGHFPADAAQRFYSKEPV
ncbi:MAG TPA: SRPBCC family protein [Tepidisphaeraceae bacterium]|nr:SRPBCC family protein [Tepidisphaeraceae bacterium]